MFIDLILHSSRINELPSCIACLNSFKSIKVTKNSEKAREPEPAFEPRIKLQSIRKIHDGPEAWWAEPEILKLLQKPTNDWFIDLKKNGSIPYGKRACTENGWKESHIIKSHWIFSKYFYYMNSNIIMCFFMDDRGTRSPSSWHARHIGFTIDSLAVECSEKKSTRVTNKLDLHIHASTILLVTLMQL